MLALVFSCAVIGLEGVVVEVVVDTGLGLPSIVDRGSTLAHSSTMASPCMVAG